MHVYPLTVAIIVFINEVYGLLFCSGLVRKEDFPHITYYCPHCRALNQPKHSEGHVSGFNSPNLGNMKGEDNVDVVNSASNLLGESILTGSSPTRDDSEKEQERGDIGSGELAS